MKHPRSNVLAFVPSTNIVTHKRLVTESSTWVPYYTDDTTSRRSLPSLRVAISPQPSSSSSSSVGSSSTAASRDGEVIPFIVEEIRQDQYNDRVFTEVCQMCIDAFFNDGPTRDRKIPFYKEWQLSYLRNLQQADLIRRRKLFPDTNMMFVARRVVPATTATARKTPLLLDLTNAYNVRDKKADYCRGEVLGFVEVTQRPYSLAGTETGTGGLNENETHRKMRRRGFHVDRPVLTNLSVQYEARKSGVGARLLEQCERQVVSRWNLQEIILEVEEDNTNALSFYAKRGYKVIFEDPTSRRFDTSGLVLRQLRCRRKIMRKSLLLSPVQMIESAMPEGDTNSVFGMAWRRIKDSVRA